MCKKNNVLILVLFISLFRSVMAENLLNAPESIAFDSLNNRWLVSIMVSGNIGWVRFTVDFEGSSVLDLTDWTRGLGDG